MNYQLRCLLNMRADVLRPNETSVNMVTVETFTRSTGLRVHVQPLRPGEAVTAYGYEDHGGYYQAFGESTADYAIGDLLKITRVAGSTSATFVGRRFWIRGLEDDSVWPGIDHQLLILEVTERST